MSKKYILILLCILFCLPIYSSGTDQATVEVMAYKSREYDTDATLNVWVKNWVDNGIKIEGMGTVIPIPESKIGDTKLDPFSVYIVSNLKNTVTITVTWSDFVNSRLETSFSPQFWTWSKLAGVQYSSPYQESIKGPYYKYQFTPTFECSTKDKVTTIKYYYRYRKAECNPNGNVKGQFSGDYSTFSGYSGLEVLPGIEANKSMGQSEMVFRRPITKEQYESLPEGIEFVSTVTISIGVD